MTVRCVLSVLLQDRGDACLLKSEERLKLSLIPRYQLLFTQIGRLDGGVKFLVDMRANILVTLDEYSINTSTPHPGSYVDPQYI